MRASSSSTETRGRGGGWVLAQFALVAVAVGLAFAPPRWPTPLAFVGLPLAAAGAALAVRALRALGRQLTPYPRPRDTATLVVTGPFALVRHPLYGGALLVLGGLSLLATVPATAAVAALGALWWRKAAVEEAHLAERFPSYAEYRRRVRRRFLPYVL